PTAARSRGRRGQPSARGRLRRVGGRGRALVAVTSRGAYHGRARGRNSRAVTGANNLVPSTPRRGSNAQPLGDCPRLALLWQDVHLGPPAAEVRRSWHLRAYGEPKTKSARRPVQLFPEPVEPVAAPATVAGRPDGTRVPAHAGGTARPQRALAALVRGATGLRHPGARAVLD